MAASAAPAGRPGASKSSRLQQPVAVRVRRSTSDGNVSGASVAKSPLNAAADELSLPWGALRDENRALREELSKAIGTTVNPLIPVRRPMAAIAGGGFRGHASSMQRKHCDCEALRAKVSRLRGELAELREARAEPAREPPLEHAVRSPAPSTPASSSFTLEIPALQSLPDVLCHEIGVQAEGEDVLQCETCTQTYIAFGESATQAVAEVCQADVQTDYCQILDPFLAIDVGVQAMHEVMEVVHVPVQTDLELDEELMPAPAAEVADAGAQASLAPPCDESWTQTTPPALASIPTQTLPLPQETVAVQASLRPEVTDACTMAVDEEAIARESDWALKLQKMEEFAKKLRSENAALEAELQSSQEMALVLRHAMHSKVLGHMSVTILCPRAECTVAGDSLVIDGWDPERLRREFERDVLPRFTRVFVEESEHKPKSSEGQHPEVMSQAMEEFAEIFRDRLANMLESCAPDATGNHLGGTRVASSQSASAPVSRTRR